jgi:hypothetical protein
LGFFAEIGQISDAAMQKEPTPEEEAKELTRQILADYQEIMSGENPTEDALITKLDRTSKEAQTIVLQTLGVDPSEDKPFGGDLLGSENPPFTPAAVDTKIYSVRDPQGQDTGILVWTRRNEVAVVATDRRSFTKRCFSEREGGGLLRSTSGHMADVMKDVKSHQPETRRQRIRY